MNRIPIQQNEPRQIERLGAQRRLYSKAKIWYGWQIVINVIIPTILSLIALVHDEAGSAGAIYGLFASVGDILSLEPRIKLLREKAAKVQEQFDCDLLSLACSPLKAVNNVTVEEVIEEYNIYRRDGTNEIKLWNWHSQEIASLPLPVARLVYQRNNCWWDKRLREKYRDTLLIFALLVGIVVLALNRPLDTSDKQIFSFALVVAAMSPFCTFLAKQWQEQSEAIHRLKDIVLHVDSITSDKTQVRDEAGLAERARQIQDEIYDNRSKSPLIPDFFYHWFRNTDEALMNQTTKRLVADIQVLLNGKGT